MNIKNCILSVSILKRMFSFAILSVCIIGSSLTFNKCKALEESSGKGAHLVCNKDQLFCFAAYNDESTKGKSCYILAVNKDQIDLGSLYDATAEIKVKPCNKEYVLDTDNGLKMKGENLILEMPAVYYRYQIEYVISFKGIKYLDGRDATICWAITTSGRLQDDHNTGIRSDKYTIDYDNMIIKGILPKTKAKDFIMGVCYDQIRYRVVIRDNMGRAINRKMIIGTGYTIEFLDGDDLKYSFSLAVSGDLIGHGEITKKGVEILRSYLLGKTKLNKVFLSAADVNGDGKVDSSDLHMMEKYFPNPFE